MKNSLKLSVFALGLTLLITSCNSCGGNNPKESVDPKIVDSTSVDSSKIDTNAIDSTKIKVDSVPQAK